MQSVYIVILIVSTVLSTMGCLRLYRQLAPMVGLKSTAVGALATLPMLGFLMVVYTPASVLVAALLLTGLGAWDEYRGVDRNLGLALTLLASSLGIVGMPVPVFPHVPIQAAALAMWLLWWVIALSAERLPQKLSSCLNAATLVLLPLVVAVLLKQVPPHLALDIAMIASAMLGALLIAPAQATAALSLRLPLIFLIGYTIWRTLAAGAWPFALASAVLLFIVFSGRRKAAGHAGTEVQHFQR